MLQPTPGPWKIEHGKVYGLNGEYITRDVSDGQYYVARMDGSTMSAFAQRANARLIAAAPELLAASEAIAKRLNVTHDMWPELQALRAAISKATGA